ncbi:ANTAR domain-containing protein [Streptomyces chartreusis]
MRVDIPGRRRICDLPQPQVRRDHAESAAPPPEQNPSSATGTERDDPATRETAELLQERDQLQHAMDTRPAIDMALGVLMARFTCEPDDAWKILVDFAFRSVFSARRSSRAAFRSARP